MKKVFIGVLAALMLFAFVACDNSGANAGAEYIAYVEATQNSGVVYVEGEKVDPADFTFKGYDVIGNEVATIPSSMFEGPSTVLAAKEDNAITFTSSVSSMYGALTAEVEVAAEEVTGIKVDATNAKTTYYGTLDKYSYEDENRNKIDISGLVVTASYEGGEKVVEIDETNVATSSVVWASVTKPVTYDLTVTYATDNTDTYTITMLPNYVDHVEMRATEDYAIYYKDAEELESVDLTYATVDENTNAVSGNGVYMVLVYQGLEEYATVSATEIGYLDANSSKYTQILSDVAVTTSGATLRAEYQILKNCKEGANRVAPIFTVPVYKNVVESIEIDSYPETLSIDNYSEKAPAGFTFKATWTNKDTTTLVTTGTASTGQALVKYQGEDDKAEDWWMLETPDLSKKNAGRTTLSVKVCYEGVTKTALEFPVFLEATSAPEDSKE